MGEYREKTNHLHEHPMRTAYKSSTRSFHKLPQKILKNRRLTFELCKVKENLSNDPANIYLFKLNNKNTRKRCEIRSNLIIKTPERQIYLLLTLNIFHTVFWRFYC